jgi:hypothetical protein
MWLSDNPNITWEIIQQNPDKDWNYEWLSSNPNITWEIIQENSDTLRFRGRNDWSYDWLSANPNITWEIIQENQDKPWNYDSLSKNTFNGRKYNWNKKLHKFYSLKIKEEIIHLIWIWKKSDLVCPEGREASKLPKDVLYIIIEILY